MGRCKHYVSIRQFLVEETTKEAMQAAVLGIQGEVGKLPSRLSGTRRVKGILTRMSLAAEAVNVVRFNAALDRLWDYFDANDVWVRFQ